MITEAIVRIPGKTCAQGLTTVDCGPADPNLLIRQHAAYCETLRALGLHLTVLPPLDDFPDAHFVEDTAVMLPSIIVVTRPGAQSRRGEVERILPDLKNLRSIIPIESPGTLDGGDVLMAEDRVFIGISDRTNRHGGEQLQSICRQEGLDAVLVNVGEGLHLKSSVNDIGRGNLLATDLWRNRSEFRDFSIIPVDDDEAYAANSLLINDSIIVPAGFPETEKKLRSLFESVFVIEMSEIRKMDGGLTCCSLRF